MQMYLDQAPCLYFSSADDGALLEVNDYLCTVLQYSRSELIGRKSEMLFTLPTRIFQQTHFFPLLKMQGHAEEIYITLKKKDGDDIPVLINAARKIINGAAVNMYVGFIVHYRKKFEEELIAAKRQAENALHENTTLLEVKAHLQKHAEELDRQLFIIARQNNELKQFSRVVTHDMQEPLRKLALFSGMLLEGHSQNEQQRLVEKIKAVSAQMHSILSGLQQYVWLNDAPLSFERITLSALLPRLIQRLETENPGVRIHLEAENSEEFDGDRAQMELLFYHLLSNAVRFKKANEVFISVLAHKAQVNQFRNVEGKYKYVDHTRITVLDKGLGFDPRFKTLLFELFKRLHNESGRGVGLAICKKIIDNHNGTITIDSRPDEGTTVVVCLPLKHVNGADGNLVKPIENPENFSNE
jgi:sigma-B regulation protein RsbU (phosphoserine phosphatase)